MPGCGICNPFCGKCKPPMERGLQCPNCGRFYFPEFSPDLICKRCGTELPGRPERKPAFCHYSGLVCAKPCVRHKIKDKDGVYRPCVYNTPLVKGSAGEAKPESRRPGNNLAKL